MADVSDEDDRLLVQLVSKEGRKIDWKKIAFAMRSTGLSKNTLRQRLKTLKRTHGPDVHQFPRWFFIDRSKVCAANRRHVRSADDPNKMGTASIDPVAYALLLLSSGRNPRAAQQVLKNAKEDVG